MKPIQKLNFFIIYYFYYFTTILEKLFSKNCKNIIYLEIKLLYNKSFIKKFKLY